ncbi:hypothetical protein [Kitasatospora sp. NPDC088783]|uniref:hypothetical protein n=1 Tax=Kitasatospora sp. NPDC088783 TaxID=3364077 RepID=UPI003816F0BA
MTLPLPADCTPVPPGQAVPPDWNKGPLTQYPLPSRVDLALASPNLWSPRTNASARRAATTLDTLTRSRLPRAVRAADALEDAAVRRAAAEVDQVLHVGFGLDRAGGALYRRWEDVHAARPGQRTVAVTTCRYAYGYALSRCEDVPLLLYSYPQHLGQLLDNPHLRLALDLERPIAMVLAGLHRSPHSGAGALLDAALTTLAPGSTLTLVGIATDVPSASGRLERHWQRQTGQRPLIVHPPSLAERIARIARSGAPGWGAPQAANTNAATLPIRAFGARYLRAAPNTT